MFDFIQIWYMCIAGCKFNCCKCNDVLGGLHFGEALLWDYLKYFGHPFYKHNFLLEFFFISIIYRYHVWKINFKAAWAYCMFMNIFSLITNSGMFSFVYLRWNQIFIQRFIFLYIWLQDNHYIMVQMKFKRVFWIPAILNENISVSGNNWFYLILFIALLYIYRMHK